MTSNMVTGLFTLYGTIAMGGFLTGLSIFTVEQEKDTGYLEAGLHYFLSCGPLLLYTTLQDRRTV
jgi:hypothetical protein